MSATQPRPDGQRKVIEKIRAVPGVSRGIASTLSTLRSNPTAVDLLQRLQGDHYRLAGRPFSLVTAREMGEGREVAWWPVVLITADTLEPEALTHLVRELAELQERLRSFRPVLLLGQMQMAIPRAAGFPADVLAPRGAGITDAQWESYRATRIVELIDSFDIALVIDAPTPKLQPRDIALLEAMSEHLARRRPLQY